VSRFIARATLITRWVFNFDVRSTGKWFLLSAAIGVVAGLGAIVFQGASQSVAHFALARIAGYSPPETAGEDRYFKESKETTIVPWLIVAVMAGGGLVSGALVFNFAPEAEGHGTDAAIDAFHYKRGFIRGRIPIIKTLASAITLGTGGSGGREGPIAQIGAGFGSFLATRLKLPTRDRRIMLVAGIAAGIGAIFRAPLAGALFATEILYREADIESDALVPAAISSIVGYSVFSLSLPAGKQFVPLFGNKLHYSLESPAELLPLGLMALLLVVAGAVYIKTFYGVRDVFHRLPIWPSLRPAIGAALAGLSGVALYFMFGRDPQSLAVLSMGYGALQTALQDAGSMGIRLLLAIALVKIVTTALTIGSGGSGGVFGPSLVIGGCLGAATGVFFHDLWPGLVPRPEIYTIVGMAGFFAGCAHAPISTIIMVSEMTGDYNLLLPTMWVSTLCFLLGRRWTLYEKQVSSRLESPAHRGDFLVDVLEEIRVRDVPLKPRQTVPESMSLKNILELIPRSRQNYFPVVDSNGNLVGIFSTDDVRSYLYDDSVWRLAVARDIMTTQLVSVTLNDDLNTALRRFTERNLDELPVLAPDSPKKLLGMLRRKDVIGVYNRRLLDEKKAIAEHD
jgi:chloride channel protein, CIC family